MSGSEGSGRIAFEASAATLPGVSAPSSVVRSVIRTASSSAKTFDSRLIERLARVAARSSSATWSIHPILGSRGSSGSSNTVGRAGAWAIDGSLGRRREQPLDGAREIARLHMDSANAGCASGCLVALRVAQLDGLLRRPAAGAAASELDQLDARLRFAPEGALALGEEALQPSRYMQARAIGSGLPVSSARRMPA